MTINQTHQTNNQVKLIIIKPKSNDQQNQTLNDCLINNQFRPLTITANDNNHLIHLLR